MTEKTQTTEFALTEASEMSRETRTEGSEQNSMETAQPNLLAEGMDKPAKSAADSGDHDTGTDVAQEEPGPAEEGEKSQETGEDVSNEGGEEKSAQRAPEEYAEFTLPEGATIDETGLTEFKSFAKEQDLTQEQAQKVLEFGGERIRAMTEAPYKAWNETQEKWRAEVKADPDIGGTKFEQSVKDASLVFVPGESNPFVKSAEEAQALRQALNTTGAGNNPSIVKMFVKMGRMMAEPGTLTGNPVKDGREFLNKMYPTMGEQ